MKKKYLFGFSFLLILALIFPKPLFLRGKQGYYHPSGLFWCTSQHSCYHELGHYIDNHNGQPSATDEFRLAIVIYVFLMEHEDDRLAVEIVSRMGAPMSEIYAELYSVSLGDVPPIFKPYYPPPNVEFHSIAFFGGRLYHGIPNAGN